IRVVQFNGSKLTFFGYDFRLASSYPASTTVGNLGGLEASLSAGNVAPWCIQAPTDPVKLADAQAFVQARAVAGVALPFCPDAVFNSPPLDVTTVDNWAKRGAINAGFAVYSYLSELANKQ